MIKLLAIVFVLESILLINPIKAMDLSIKEGNLKIEVEGFSSKQYVKDLIGCCPEISEDPLMSQARVLCNKEDYTGALELMGKKNEESTVHQAFLSFIHFQLGNYEDSFYLAKKSASLNNVIGMKLLVDAYREGTGIKKDPNEAFFWTKKLSEVGFFPAKLLLATMYHNGEGCEKKEEIFLDLMDQILDERGIF